MYGRTVPILLMTVAMAMAILNISGHNEAIQSPDIMAPPPTGYLHRPIMEFFTGLSCPSCMGDSPDADSPEKAVHDNYRASIEDPTVPFTTVVFHQLNGGGEDSLRTEEAEERMRFYQPGLSGTPDVEIDGGYIEIGGFSTSQTPITESTVSAGLDTASTRYNDKPLRPLERATWSFPYVTMEVREKFDGEGAFYVEVKATYLANAKTVGAPALRGSLYIFMVEDNVTAFSKVYEGKGIEDPYVRNDAVFRGYALKGEQITLNARDEGIYTGTWTIPDAEVDIKPQDVYAVAALYDTGDTSSGGSDANKKANSPRCVQSATSRSTAYDTANEKPTLSSFTLKDGTVTVAMADDGGIAEAYLFYTGEFPELPEVPIWTPLRLEVTGEELCDDTGTCYAYSDPVGTARIPTDDATHYQVLMYDDQMVQSSSDVLVVGEGGSAAEKDATFGASVSFPVIMVSAGALIAVGGIIAFVLTRKKRTPFVSSKAALALFVSVGILVGIIGLSNIGGSSTTVPDFSVTDTDGKTHTPETYSGKVLVIDIMFADCSFCNKEMPDLVDVFEYAKEKHGSEVEFLTVSIEKKDSDSDLEAFQAKYGAEWPIARDPSFIQKFDALSVPKLVVVSQSGEIAYTHKGVIDPKDTRDAIDDAVSGNYRATSIGQRSTSLVMLLPLAAGFGVLTFFSPCSFPMLPGYLSYYVSQDLRSDGKKNNPVKGGIFAALGILTFFLLVGILVAIFGAVVQRYLFNLMPIVGGILLLLGLSILLGFDHFLEVLVEYGKKPFQAIGKAIGMKATDGQGAGGLFAYGFGYGAASSSCMAPLFIAVMVLGFSAGSGLLGGGLVFLAYAVSLGTMMVVISLLVSTSQGLINKLVSSMTTIKRVSGALLLATGAFVIWYFFMGYRYFTGFLGLGF